MTQPDLISVIDSHVLNPQEQARLSAQSSRILARLQMGPATNRQLAELSLKYTSRLSDLRHAGYVVTIIERDRTTGRVVYALGAKAR